MSTKFSANGSAVIKPPKVCTKPPTITTGPLFRYPRQHVICWCTGMFPSGYPIQFSGPQPIEYNWPGPTWVSDWEEFDYNVHINFMWLAGTTTAHFVLTCTRHHPYEPAQCWSDPQSIVSSDPFDSGLILSDHWVNGPIRAGLRAIG